MLKYYLTIIVLLGMVRSGYSQQEYQFTQYMFNQFAINPAFAGNNDALSVAAHYRKQWAGLEGAPNTQLLSAHSPLKNENLGVGLLIANDKVGVHQDLNISASFSYKINFDKEKNLSFGLQAGMINKRADYTGIFDATSDTDLAFTQDNYNTTSPEFGFGIYYLSKTAFAGISMPKLSGNMFMPEYINNNRHIYIHGGYVFELNDVVKIQPSTLVKMVENAPINIDLNTNVVFNDVLALGISYRTLSTFSFLAQVQVTSQLRFGYAYDSATRKYSEAIGGSHEVMLSYDFTFFKSKVIIPRYF
ncbi:type IX secretion system membrane protein PorP/SprF [Flammeovirgaceae bacterium SG7u.111]|nr:type IX secretion system membrane protein PorP/SprF [Flammeovirgaceae bacterium SG7u.132]WPO36211.1 type IX secretion system membrane protein PorP/SprF [Flammeovirgaceae bacterium SG7u.111]